MITARWRWLWRSEECARRKKVDGNEKGDVPLCKALDANGDSGKALAELCADERHSQGGKGSRCDHLPEFEILFANDGVQTVGEEGIVGRKEGQCLRTDGVRRYEEQSFKNCLIDLWHRHM